MPASKVKLEPVEDNEKAFVVIRPRGEMYTNTKNGFSCKMGVNGKIVHGSTPAQVKAYEEELNIKTDQAYWGNYQITLYDTEQRWKYADAATAINLNILKLDPRVCVGEERANSFTKYVIIDEEAEAQAVLKKSEKQMQAMGLLNALSSLEKENFISLYGTRGKEMSPALIARKLIEHAMADPDTFIRRHDDQHRRLKEMIQKLIQHGKIEKKGQAMYYGKDEERFLIGVNTEQALVYLEDVKNADFKAALLKMADQL